MRGKWSAYSASHSASPLDGQCIERSATASFAAMQLYTCDGGEYHIGRCRRPRGLTCAMASLIAAAGCFLALHFGVSGTRLRDRLVGAVGERVYGGLFALASVVGLIWMGRAYSHTPHLPLWGQLLTLRPLAFALVFIAFTFIV